MNYSLMPSLEHIALVKIVTTLWNNEDIRALLVKCYLNRYNNCFPWEQWLETERCVAGKVALLHQPKLLEEKILGAIKPIGDEIRKWVYYNSDTYDFAINLQEEFYWTPQGLVDYKKMAEALMRNETTVIRRYKVACTYCLENEAEELWKNMPEDCRRRFCTEEGLQEVEQHSWQNIFAYDDNKGAFKRAFMDGNEVAAKYFWHQLSPEERLEFITRMADWYPRVLEIGVFRLLIPLMNEEQQMKLFEYNPEKVINFFLEWPFQNYSMEVINRAWNFLPLHNYLRLLDDIALKIWAGKRDYNYQGLFKQFWMQSPKDFKIYVINRFVSSFLLKKLLEGGDEKNISLILKNATPAQKKKILFHYLTIYVCKRLVNSNRWNLVNFIINECTSSAKEIEMFKDKLREK